MLTVIRMSRRLGSAQGSLEAAMTMLSAGVGEENPLGPADLDSNISEVKRIRGYYLDINMAA